MMAVPKPTLKELAVEEVNKGKEGEMPRTITNDEFKRLMEKTGAEHYGLFKKLAQ